MSAHVDPDALGAQSAFDEGDSNSASDRGSTVSLTWALEKHSAVIGLLLALLLTAAAAALFAPRLLEADSLLGILPLASVLGLVSVGQMLVVQQRGFDLSIPGSMGLCAAVVTKVADGDDGRLVVAVLAALVVGAVIGALNAMAVVALRITPIVATLAVNALATGAYFTYTSGRTVAAPSRLSRLAVDSTAGVPNVVLITALPVLVILLGLALTAYGRGFVASGIAPRAATVAAVRVRTHVAGAYVLAGLCYAVAAIALAGYLRVPGAQLGSTYLFASVAAVVMGGTSLAGGRGNVAGTVLAALFLTFLVQLLYSLGAPTSTQLIVQAGAIAVAALLGGGQLRLHRLAIRGRGGVVI